MLGSAVQPVAIHAASNVIGYGTGLNTWRGIAPLAQRAVQVAEWPMEGGETNEMYIPNVC